MIGRISVIKMNLFPRVMFVLQNIPVVRGNKIWDVWHRKISKFICAGKKPRVKLKSLMDDISTGSLRVPDFKIYQEAILLRWSKEWITQRNSKLLNLEGFSLKYGWHTYMLHEKHKMDNLFNHHYIRKNILEVWLKYKPRILIKFLYGPCPQKKWISNWNLNSKKIFFKRGSN